MVKKEYVIRCESGLHARPACELADLASTFESQIIITNLDDEDLIEADAKSILNILTLGADKGAHVLFQAEGPDEEEAVEKIILLLDSIME